MAETKAERDGNASARKVSRSDIVARDHTHNFVTNYLSRKCIPIAKSLMAPRPTAPGVRPPAGGTRQRLHARLDLKSLADDALAVAVSARALYEATERID